jgi:hypothetical protein
MQRTRKFVPWDTIWETGRNLQRKKLALIEEEKEIYPGNWRDARNERMNKRAEGPTQAKNSVRIWESTGLVSPMGIL